MKLKILTLLGVALCFFAIAALPAQAASTDCKNAQLLDVERTYWSLPSDGTPNCYQGQSYNTLPLSQGHIQGTARWENYLIFTQNVTSTLEFYDISSGVYSHSYSFSNVKLFNTELRHYGGCQQIGDYLVVPIESQGDERPGSIICFYDIRNNNELVNLRINRFGIKAGAAGITNYQKNGRTYYCLTVLDGQYVDIYEADKPLSDPECSFSHKKGFTLPQDVPDDNFESINLAADIKQELYIFGFRSTMHLTEVQGGYPVEDYIDLFKFDYSASDVPVSCTQVGTRHITTRNQKLVWGPHCRYGAGIEFNKSNKASVWVVERNPEFSKLHANSFISEYDPHSVALYEDRYYMGKITNLNCGKYDIGKLGIGNDTLSSIKVPEDRLVTVFRDSNFRNYMSTVAKDLVFESDKDNMASSITIEPTISIDGQAMGAAGVWDFIPRRNTGFLSIPDELVVTIYDQTGLTGNSKFFKYSTSTAFEGLTNPEFSMVAEAAATFYSDANFDSMFCEKLKAGTYPTCTGWGMDDDISSIKIPSGLKVTVYDQPNFGGNSKSFTKDTAYVGDDFNDRIKSVIIERVVTIYQGDAYSGRSTVLCKGNYTSFSNLGIDNDTLSSMEIPAGFTVYIYEHANYQGNRKILNCDTPLFGDFNDKASSMIIMKDDSF